MNHTHAIQHAIAFAIEVHETHQKQKRKGKDVPYITHPLTVGLILARAGADEDVVCAGILHDVIEDSVSKHKVTREMLAERFGNRVADLVAAVSEDNKSLSWGERKAAARAHVAEFSHDEVLVKSADVISNTSEIIADHARDGDAVWNRFNAPKEAVIDNIHRLIDALITRWPESPLVPDLVHVQSGLSVR